MDESNQDKDLRVINNICTTLDASLIDKLSDESRDVFVNEVFMKHYQKKGLDGFKYRSLAELIYNHITKPVMSYPSFIMGPNMLTRLVSKKYNKILYMFGETHLPFDQNSFKCEKDSMRVSDFLKNVFKNSSKPIDFFLETPPSDANFNQESRQIKFEIQQTGIQKFKKYEEKERERRKEEKKQEKKQENEENKSKDIIYLRDIFRNCYNITKKDCKYLTTRSHYVDLRQIPEYPTLGLTYQASIGYQAKVNRIELDIDMIVDDLPEMMRIVDHDLVYEFPKFDQDLFYRKVQKQIDRLTDSDVTREVNKIVEKYKELKYTYNLDKIKDIYDSLTNTYIKPHNLKISPPSDKDMYKNQPTCIFYLKKMYNVIGHLYKNKLYLIKYLESDIGKEVNISMVGSDPEWKQTFIKMLTSKFAVTVQTIINAAMDYTATAGLEIMDAYTLARMFRTFRQIEFQNSSEPVNIVYYGGLFHTRNLIQVIKNIGSFEEEVFSSTLAKPGNLEYPYCIDITKMNNDMFSSELLKKKTEAPVIDISFGEEKSNKKGSDEESEESKELDRKVKEAEKELEEAEKEGNPSKIRYYEEKLKNLREQVNRLEDLEENEKKESAIPTSKEIDEILGIPPEDLDEGSLGYLENTVNKLLKLGRDSDARKIQKFIEDNRSKLK